MAPGVEVINLGAVEYEEGRKIQRRLIEEHLRGDRGATLIICEHPPVITLGVRSKEFSSLLDIPVIRTNRGGEATYHGPGQLILYPVITVKSVRTFVEDSLNTIAKALSEFGIQAEGKLHPAGVWTAEGKKIAACGLKIVRKVTDHGFSVNIENDLDVYRHFSPCGLNGEAVTSVKAAAGRSFPPNQVADRVVRLYTETLRELSGS